MATVISCGTLRGWDWGVSSGKQSTLREGARLLWVLIPRPQPAALMVEAFIRVWPLCLPYMPTYTVIVCLSYEAGSQSVTLLVVRILGREERRLHQKY